MSAHDVDDTNLVGVDFVFDDGDGGITLERRGYPLVRPRKPVRVERLTADQLSAVVEGGHAIPVAGLKLASAETIIDKVREHRLARDKEHA